MGRPYLRALLIALISVMSILPPAWGRSRTSPTSRKGHPNEYRYSAALSSTPVSLLIVRLPISGVPLFVISTRNPFPTNRVQSQSTLGSSRQETERD